MAKYSITFENLPKQLSRLRVIKKDKVYTLPEAEYLYQQMMNQAEEKGLDFNTLENMICVIKIERPDEDNEFPEFEIPAYDPSNPKLSDKISFDLSKERSMLSDSEEDQQKLKQINSIEEGIMDEFLKPYDPEESEKQEDYRKGRHSKHAKKMISLPFSRSKQKKTAEKEGEGVDKDQIQRQLAEEAQFEASVPPKVEEVSNVEPPVQSPRKEDIQSPKPIVEGEATKQFIQNTPKFKSKEAREPEAIAKPVVNKTEMKEPISSQPMTRPINKAQFVQTNSDEIQQSIQQLLAIIRDPKEKGFDFILQHLVYQPDDSDFVKKEKKDYLKDVYSTQDLEKHYLELKAYIQQLQNESNQALNDYYEQVMKRDDSKALEEEHQRLKKQIQAEYKERFEQLNQQLDQEYQLAKEAMETRHEQELKDLKQRQSKEIQHLSETHKNKKHASQQDLEQALTSQFKQTWKEKEFEGKEAIQTKKNADLTIGKENILSQLKSNLQAKELEEHQFMKQWIARWNKGIQSKQESFQHSYTLYQEKLAKEAEEKQRQEEQAKEERRLKLEEEKLAVEKQQTSAGEIQKDAEIQQLQQKINDLNQQLDSERLENANIQNQFLQTIQDQRQQMSQWVSYPTSSPEKKSDSVPLSKVKKWIVGGVATALLATGAVGFGVKAHYDHVAEAKAQQEAKQAQTEKQKKLEESLEKTKATLDEVKRDNESLNKENQKQAKQLESQKKAKDDSK